MVSLLSSVKSFSERILAANVLHSTIPAEHRLAMESPIALLKACKNSAELQGMRACHLRDGAAIVEFLAWLDERYAGTGALSTLIVFLSACFYLFIKNHLS